MKNQLKMEDRGQKVEVWKQEWEKLSPEAEIKMWDYFGLRQWILKYTPRYGKVLEAGCGLGRYNFYLNHFGVETIGLDFSGDTIDFLKEWQKKYNYNLEFLKGDVKKLPFENNSLGGYLSFGVVEHFIEGPQKPIEEAFRVLRPGGIAIISTPAPSWSKIYFSIIGFIKKRVKLLIGRTVDDKVFFQYEYTPIKLKKHVESIGFYISRFSGADWLYTFTEFGKNSDRFIKKGSFGYLLSHWFEHGILSFLGAQSIVIAIKKEKLMHCFLCGIKAIIEDSLKEFDVPICNGCKASSTAQYYKKGNIVSYGKKYLISSSILKPCEKDCDFCGNKYFTDELFEDFGFSKNVCMKCLNNKRVGFELSNTDIQPIWRSRGRR